MVERIKRICKKYIDIIPYLFFGVCTTVVNVISYWCAAHVFNVSIMMSTIVAWIIAVTFAYVTNRKWVFKSEANNISKIAKEIISFFCCRLATGFVDWLCMFLFVEKMKLDDILIKVIANGIVIVLNYLASKFVIFVKKK